MKQVAFTRLPIPQAAPLPDFRRVDHAGAKWVRFDVTHHCHEVAVAFDDLAPVAPLKHMTVTPRTPASAQIASMFTLDEMHVRRNCLEPRSSNDQVEVVRHQTIRVEFDVISLARFSKENQKCSVINSFRKNDLFVVPAIHDVQDAVSGNLACGSAHRLTPRTRYRRNRYAAD